MCVWCPAVSQLALREPWNAGCTSVPTFSTCTSPWDQWASHLLHSFFILNSPLRLLFPEALGTTMIVGTLNSSSRMVSLGHHLVLKVTQWGEAWQNATFHTATILHMQCCIIPSYFWHMLDAYAAKSELHTNKKKVPGGATQHQGSQKHKKKFRRKKYSKQRGNLKATIVDSACSAAMEC